MVRAQSDSGAAAAATAPMSDSSSAPADFVGQVIDGRYRIDELIGEGGMGRVYLAEHVEIGKRVAIKILHPVYGRMPDLVERFRREARAASRIGHPHIVDVTDSGTTADGSVYFVMEYLEGVELAGVIDREGALDIARALKVATQICRALSAAHAVGIIHRDLKPENVFLTVREGAADFVKVLDFGIAKSSEAEEARGKRLTHPGMAMGTPEYMSPEQAAGRPADERCDVYAVGAILYEMLTGVPPYEGDNFMEILTKKATIDPATPCSLRNEIPSSVENVVMAAMSRDPDKRPPSMESFEYELTKCLSGRGAAVAKILGIPSDAALLGAGMYMPHDELTPSGVGVIPPAVRARLRAELAQATAASNRAAARGGAGSGSGPAAGPVNAAVTPPAGAMAMTGPAFEMGDRSESTELVHPHGVPDLRGAGLRMFGWGLLILLLAAAGAAVFLALHVERSGEAQVPAAAVTTTGGPGAAAPTRAATDDHGDRADRDHGRSKDSDHGDKSGGHEGRRASAGGDRGPRSAVDRDSGKDDSGGVPRSAREAEALLKEAADLSNQLKWDKARAKYQQVVAGRFRKEQGYLGLAEVAFQNKRADDIISYAKRAGNGIRARMLLGHGYYQKGQYATALKYYQSVLKKNPNYVEAQNAAKGAREQLELKRKRRGK